MHPGVVPADRKRISAASVSIPQQHSSPMTHSRKRHRKLGGKDANRRPSPNIGHFDLLAGVLEALPVGVTVRADGGDLLMANREACKLGPALLNGMVASGLALHDAADPIITEEQSGNDGKCTTLLSRRRVRVQDRDLTLSVSVDITDRKRAEIELERRAYFDVLTGLPNRSLIQEHAETLIARNPRACFAVAFIDMDNFKHINDHYTHAIGDGLLKHVAQRIGSHIRPTDFFGRISGDEFMLLVNPLDDRGELIDFMEQVQLHLREPFCIEGFEIFTSASMGASIYPDHGQNFEVLRRNADSAMYRAKGAVKGTTSVFDSDIGRAMATRTVQDQRLRLAVRDQLFCCAFQPKVDLRTQDVVGVEALVRLRDELGVMDAPGEFISLAAELGLMNDLTRLVLADIVKSLDAIDEAFGADTPISVNVAAKQATDIKFMRSFCEDLSETHCAGRFIVEVTEDAFVNKSRFQSDIVPMLHELGVRVSIDDFGTGYSSLSALSEITADEIKIDRSFIVDIHRRPRSQRVLKAIESLGNALGMHVMVEGVETFEELLYLQAETGIRYGQGYYFAKPILIDSLVRSRTMRANAIGDLRREAGMSRRVLRGARRRGWA
jgi:c-di-GMP phosphodiesterase Gmr